MEFLGFSNHEKGAPRQEILKWSMVCSTFLRSGQSTVRTALLAKGHTLKKRLSLHLHKVPTQSNNVSPWTLQTALIHGHHWAVNHEHVQEYSCCYRTWRFISVTSKFHRRTIS
jgi:hypothetical protein